MKDCDKSPQHRMRYLMVIKNLTFLYSHFWALAEAIRDAGCEVWVAAAMTDDPKQVIDAKMNYVPIHPPSGAWDLLGEVRGVLQTHRALRRIEPDIAHFIYLKNVLAGGVLSRINSVPAVLGAITGLGTLFADDRMTYRAVRTGVLAGIKAGFRGRNAILALENTDDERLLIMRGAAQKGRTFVIPGAGLERDAAAPIAGGEENPIILCATRMIRPKGVGILIQAARLLRQRGLQFTIWLAGGTDQGNPQSLSGEELRHAESLGLVNWLGYRSDMPHLLEQCSFVCLPTYYREGLPRALVEAAAAGRAIITTDVPGCRDVVSHESNGLLVPPRNVVALAEALERLIVCRELRIRMGLASRQVFEERFELSAVFAAFNECYRQLGLSLRLRTKFSPRRVCAEEEALAGVAGTFAT